ncbi:MAG: nitroreductase family protein [Thermodesulfovibrionales bacterium]
MEVAKAIRERRSVRRFEDREIPGEAVDGLVEALIWAPSAGNLQSRKFYFVKDPAVKKQLAAAAFNQSFIADAPLVVVGCTDRNIFGRYGERGTELYTIQDVAASLMCMMLAAYEAGLGTVWVGAFREEDAAQALQTPSHLRPVAIVPVGYPKKTPPPPRRVSREEAVEFV